MDIVVDVVKEMRRICLCGIVSIAFDKPRINFLQNGLSLRWLRLTIGLLVG